MPLLNEEDLDRLRALPRTLCPACRGERFKDYCRECDEFFEECDCPHAHLRHRTYAAAILTPHAVPAQYVGVASGYSAAGPPLRVKVGDVARDEALDTPDIGKDVVVVTLRDLEVAAANRLGFGEYFPVPGGAASRPEKAYALKTNDARMLLIQLLHHLASTGEPMARGLLKRVDEVAEEVRRERGG